MGRTFVGAVVSALFAVSCTADDPLSVSVSESSIRLNGVELRSGPRVGTARYISLDAVKSVLGQPRDTYVAGLGVTVYAWPSAGIHVQRGFRGPDEGKIFKFQVWFQDNYDKNEDKHSGKFSGHVRIGQLDITPDTTFDSIRHKLEQAGFETTEYPNVTIAKKGEVSILTLDTTNKIERVEVWCS